MAFWNGRQVARQQWVVNKLNNGILCNSRPVGVASSGVISFLIVKLSAIGIKQPPVVLV